jgi:hypothetical protein
LLFSLIVLPAVIESFREDQQGNVKHVGNDIYIISQLLLLTVAYFKLFLLFGVPGKKLKGNVSCFLWLWSLVHFDEDSVVKRNKNALKIRELTYHLFLLLLRSFG